MMQTLYDLYFINSKSRNEHKISSYVQEKLNKLNVKYTVKHDGTIYQFNKNKPLICAHLDQIGIDKLNYIINDSGKLYGNTNLGADDKNGVWILLKLLELYPNLSFIFSTQEEVGGNIFNLLKDNEQILTSIPYALVFDRRNGKDIIGTQNCYCNKDLESEIEKIGKNFGYKSASGMWSDCDNLCRYIPCVNLSCGYYKAHTNEEYTSIIDLKNALEFGKTLIGHLPHLPYELPDIYHDFELFDSWADDYEDEFEPLMCPHCKSDNVDYWHIDGYYICLDCLEVFEWIEDYPDVTKDDWLQDYIYLDQEA